jgi:threonine/homoserine/homoserine lactone efflux protein
MSVELYLVFVVASALLVATPGPNVALIVGTSLTHGLRTGLTAVAGVNVGVVIQLAVVALGLSWVVDLFARHFDVIRFAGAAYLLFLGISTLWKARKPSTPQPLSPERAFARGFAVAFANPKTLIFQAAFLPQFLSTGAEHSAQLWLLAATFGFIAAVGDVIWALCAARLRAAMSDRVQLLADRISGGILIGGAGVLLAMSRR